MTVEEKEFNEYTNMIRKRSPIYIMLGFAFLIGLVIWGYISWQTTDVAKTAKPLHMKGIYSFDDSTIQYEFDDLSEIQCDGHNAVKISGVVEEMIPPGQEIFIFVHRATAKIKINDMTVFSATSGWNQAWEGYTSRGIGLSDVVEIEIDGMSGYKKMDVSDSIENSIQQICVGTRYELLRQQVYKNILKIFFCFLILIMGIAELFTALMLILMQSADIRGSVSCSLFLIAGAMCCFIDHNYINLFVTNAKMLYLLDIVMQLFACLFLMINMMFHMHSKRNWKRSNYLIAGWCMVVYIYVLGLHFNFLPLSEEQWLTIIASVVGLCLLLEAVMMLMDYRMYREPQMRYVLGSTLVMVISILIEIIYFVWNYTFIFYPFQIGLLIYASLQFLVVYKQSAERERLSKRALELEKELVESQVAIMLSQIRPHFLYNSITAMQTLCVKDPEQARKSLGDFAKFLRGNMDSLACRELISFSKELEHTQHYVELEKMRYGEELEVIYRIDERVFELPSLSLQPLVENAIKHGIGAKEEGGTVIISTRREKDNIIISVEDDGVGFDVDKVKLQAQKDERTHIGIENVANRIDKMTGGTLRIESVVGEGTKAEIVLPQNR